MSRMTKWMDRTFYPNHQDKWDVKLLRERVLQRLGPEVDLLDLGAGRGANEDLNFKGHCRMVAGVDVDDAVLTNPYLDEAKLQTVPDFKIPYPDNRFDVVFCHSVVEHVEDADAFFTEACRVLKPNGIFLAKTPNKRHYVAVLASLTPTWFHDFYNRLLGRGEGDTFPTTYVCNTPGQMDQVSTRCGFEVVAVDVIEGRPEYLRISFPTYLVGLAYERTVNFTNLFRRIRCVLIGEFRKPAAS